MANADALSSLPLPETINHVPEPAEHKLLINHLNEILVTASHIKQWTDTDPVLSRVRHFIQSGWSDCEEDSKLIPYVNRKAELSVLNGCVLWGARVVIPSKGQEIILKQLHEGHAGTTKMKALARSFVWWPGMDSTIKDCVRNCSACQDHRASPSRAPLHPWEWPNRPWARIHMDHAGPFLGHLFLIVVDAHSKWIEAHIVSSTSADATIHKLQQIFATHGYPEQIVSDNGTGFASAEFQEYTKTHGILHTFTAPYHPSSNGMAERSVQTLKMGLKKSNGSIQDRLSQFLFHYRTTPHTTTGLSPAEMLMGRRLRSKLTLLHPDTGSHVIGQQEKMCVRTSSLRSFQKGEKVYAKAFGNKKGWIPVTVETKAGPVSYQLKTLDGQVIRRHVDHVRKRYSDDSENPQMNEPDVLDDWPVRVPRSAAPIGTPNVVTSSQDRLQLAVSTNVPLRRSSRPRRPVDRYVPQV